MARQKHRVVMKTRMVGGGDQPDPHQSALGVGNRDISGCGVQTGDELRAQRTNPSSKPPTITSRVKKGSICR